MTQHKIDKILIIGPSWVGDMVMAQSLFMALRQNNPDVQIDVLAPDWSRPLLERMPEVHQAISMPVTHGMFAWQQRKAIGLSLRDKNYDQAIILPNSWKSALIPWFAKIPVRTGWLGEMRYGLLNDPRKLDKHALPMMVQRFVALAQPAADARTPPAYQKPHMIAARSATTIDPPRIEHQQRLILCPGAEFGPAKQWPAAHYADLAVDFIEMGWQVLIMGSKADASTGDEICAHVDPALRSSLINLCGRTQLAEAIDLIDTADVVVSNDSGLMHIAAALQKPLIAIYGPTSTAFTPPLSELAQIVQLPIECSPCFKRECPLGHHKCMKDIQAETITAKIKHHFAK
ncbi:lipopolysaccharide heptosyltransferase II [Methylophaga lonarensis]|uniref:lipopolysaccharide heptosyltransferase II n=1 Tax=Methylophaga lonarensis TaxID=999151 RepID=UPI003D28BE99